MKSIVSHGHQSELQKKSILQKDDFFFFLENRFSRYSEKTVVGLLDKKSIKPQQK